jgi:hypothetical protein
MAFMLLAIGVLFTIGWGIGLIFSLKSDAPRNPVIPALGILAFLWLGYTGLSAAMKTMDNPARLSGIAYDTIKDGMSPDQVNAVFGAPMVKPDRQQLDLAGKGVSLPGEIVARLAQGEDRAEAVSAKLSITIEGEPSKRKAKTGLGASAANEGNGLVGLQIVLAESGNETTITEGEHWTYVNLDTAEMVAQKIGQAIDAHPSWAAQGGSDEAPKRITIQSELASNGGEPGNNMTCRAAPKGKNTAVRVGYRDDGGTVSFRGGQHSVELRFWLEKDQVLDGDFTLTDRLVVVGYMNEQVKTMKQAGLGVTVRDLLVKRISVQAKYEKVLEEKQDAPDPAATVEALSIKETLDDIDKALAKKGVKA